MATRDQCHSYCKASEDKSQIHVLLVCKDLDLYKIKWNRNKCFVFKNEEKREDSTWREKDAVKCVVEKKA